MDASSHRNDSLLQKQQEYLGKNNITEVNENETISINAGGTVFKVKRGTLGISSKVISTSSRAKWGKKTSSK